MRGKIVPAHCAPELPHGSDHSSPASFQSYFIELRADSWLQRPTQITVVHDVMMEEFASQCSRKKAMRKVLTRRSITTALVHSIWQQRLLPPVTYLGAAERT